MLDDIIYVVVQGKASLFAKLANIKLTDNTVDISNAIAPGTQLSYPPQEFQITEQIHITDKLKNLIEKYPPNVHNWYRVCHTDNAPRDVSFIIEIFTKKEES